MLHISSSIFLNFVLLPSQLLLIPSCAFHLRNITKLRTVVSKAEMKMFILFPHAWTTTNALLTCRNKSSMDVFKLSKLLLRGLERGPTEVCISRLFQSVYTCLQCSIFEFWYHCYISDLFHPYTLSRAVRSTNQALRIVPQNHLKTPGDRAFQTVAPKLWYALPLALRANNSMESFKKELKPISSEILLGCQNVFHVLVLLCALIVSSVLFSIVI